MVIRINGKRAVITLDASDIGKPDPQVWAQLIKLGACGLASHLKVADIDCLEIECDLADD